MEFEGLYNDLLQLPRRNRRNPPLDRVLGPRLPPASIRAGRNLLRALHDIRYRPVEEERLIIRSIHPHGQFKADKVNSCPGLDIWVNVGDWAIREFGWTLRRTGDDEEISRHQSNPAYRQVL